jgi:hypothetical protein
MSRATMIEAAAQLPRSPLYGLASCKVGTTYLDFEVGWPEFERDTQWAEAQLRQAGLGRGDMVLTTLTNWESPWTSPVVHALRSIGVTYLTAEVFAWDVRRVWMFLQRFPVKAAIGIGGQTLTALTQTGAPVRELLGKLEIIWARPNALAALGEHQPRVLPFVRFGPALAMGRPGASTALINASEWNVVETADGLVVSSVAERAATFLDIATGFRGTATRLGDEIAVSLAAEPA